MKLHRGWFMATLVFALGFLNRCAVYSSAASTNIMDASPRFVATPDGRDAPTAVQDRAYTSPIWYTP